MNHSQTIPGRVISACSVCIDGQHYVSVTTDAGTYRHRDASWDKLGADLHALNILTNPRKYLTYCYGFYEESIT